MANYSIKKISLVTDIPYSTLLTYLGHYSFDKYRKGNKYEVSDPFYKTLINYLCNRRTCKYIKNIERLMNEND